MNILLLNPEFPDTFWSYKHALSFTGKRAAFPPLGLATIAALLPAEWDIRIVDMNVTNLHTRDLEWADYAFIGAMTVQRDAARRLISRCNASDLPVVAGGPLFTMEHESFDGVAHFVLNEAEITLPRFLEDLANERALPVYASEDFADMTQTPTPRWDKISLKSYHAMSIQYSRGCPFNCDFCNITSLLGHQVRIKRTAQIVAELDALYDSGWRGRMFFVDDNFIGNKRRLKNDLLPALIEWRRTRKGVVFQTEASIDLADDESLMTLMRDAGFDTVFIGIETPDEAALSECGKKQNTHRDLVADVHKIQRAGMQVQGGFIVGFDCDEASVFQRQIDFIQKSGIVTAMVGLLQAPQGTRLYQRMAKLGRLRGNASGDNVEGTTNIQPVMDFDRLHAGYTEILHHIYTPRNYYRRIRTLLRETPRPKFHRACSSSDIKAVLRSLYRLGILGKERLHYWHLLAWTFARRPSLLPLAITLAISGYHYRMVCEQHIR